MSGKAHLALLAVIAALVPGAALGGWSADSLANLEVCDLSGEQVTPKMVPTSDGGCWISWFDSRDGGYAMYLQRLDAGGNSIFPDEGLLVSDHPQQSWLVDYGLAVDDRDRAVVAFSDIRYGDLDVFAYMVDGSGDFVWGADGICLSDTTQELFEPAASVAVTPEGNAVVAWGRSGTQDDIALQKLSPAGARLWGEAGLLLQDPSRDLSQPLVVPSGPDSAIVLYKSSTGSYPMVTTHLYVGLLDSDGDWGWGDTPILIYDIGAITPWTTPEIVPDGSGGAVCCWYDSPSLTAFDVRVQYIDADGDPLYPHNGALASVYSNDRLHMQPSAEPAPTPGQAVVFWVESNFDQDRFGVSGQLLDEYGDRQWGDAGLELVPPGGDQTSFVRLAVDDSAFTVGYLTGGGATAARAHRLGWDGSALWGPVSFSAASLGGKDDLVACGSLEGRTLFAWCDYRNDYGIYAQNVNADGSLGVQTGVGWAGSATVHGLLAAPNPCITGSIVTFRMESAGPAELAVFDTSGRRVDLLVRSTLESGEHSVDWKASHPPGIYFLRLTTSGGAACSRLVVL